MDAKRKAASVCDNCVVAGNEDLPYYLATDASKTGIGEVLYQIVDGIELIICFISYQLTAIQSKWHTTEREAFAICKCVEECNMDITWVTSVRC